MSLLFLAVAVFTGLARGAVAVPIAVTNASFEDTSGQTVFNEFTFGTPAGWALHDPSNIVPSAGVFPGTLLPNGVDFFNGPAPEGERVAILFNSQQLGAGEYGFMQTLGDVLQAGTRYELSVEVGNIASGFASNGDFFDLSEFPGYRIELLAGGTVIAQDVNGLGGVIPEGEFATASVSYDALAGDPLLGQALGVRLVNLNEIPAGFDANTSPDLEVDFDDVRLEATDIDAPGSLSLLAVGLAGLALRRHYRLSSTG